MKKKQSPANFPLTTVKAIIKEDSDFGKIRSEALDGIAKSADLFLTDLLKYAIAVAATASEEASHTTSGRSSASSSSGSTHVKGKAAAASSFLLSPSHIKKVVMDSLEYDFLRDMIEEMVDGPTEREPSTKAAKPKKGAATSSPAKKSTAKAEKSAQTKGQRSAGAGKRKRSGKDTIRVGEDEEEDVGEAGENSDVDPEEDEEEDEVEVHVRKNKRKQIDGKAIERATAALNGVRKKAPPSELAAVAAYEVLEQAGAHQELSVEDDDYDA